MRTGSDMFNVVYPWALVPACDDTLSERRQTKIAKGRWEEEETAPKPRAWAAMSPAGVFS
jgi:hypothetical protein